MQYEIEKVKTPSGQTRHQLRVWNFGPDRKEFKRRFLDKNLLLAKLSELQAKEQVALSGAKVDPNNIEFGFLNFDWRRRRVPSFSPSWKRTVRGYYKELRKKLSRVPASEITPDFLKTLEQELLKKGNSQKTCNSKIGFILSVLNFAVEMERIQSNPAKKFKKQKPATPSIEFWEREDAEDFLNFTAAKYPKGSEDRWKHVVYLVGINVALRAGEIWALKPRCLKESMGVMRIDEQYDRVQKGFRTLKGRSGRNVPLNQTVYTELIDLIRDRRIGRHELIFQNDAGLPIDHDNFYDRVFQKDLTQWQGPKIKFHGLRHTGATLMLSSGVDLKTVSEILGHKDITTTARYVHLLSASIKAAGEMFSVSGKGSPKLSVVRQGTE